MAASSERDSARLLPARPMVSNVGREPGAGAPSALASGRLAVNEVGGDDVFHRDTDRLEERDLVRGLPTGRGAGHHLTDLERRSARRDDIPRLAHRRLPRLDVDPRPAKRLVVQFAPDRKSTRLNSSHLVISYA